MTLPTIGYPEESIFFGATGLFNMPGKTNPSMFSTLPPVVGMFSSPCAMGWATRPV